MKGDLDDDFELSGPPAPREPLDRPLPNARLLALTTSSMVEFHGHCIKISELARRFDLPALVLLARLRQGLPPEFALNPPERVRSRPHPDDVWRVWRGSERM
jgi:hypothetical protein